MNQAQCLVQKFKKLSFLEDRYVGGEQQCGEDNGLTSSGQDGNTIDWIRMHDDGARTRSPHCKVAGASFSAPLAP